MKKVEVLLNTIDDKEEDVCRICYKDKYLRRCIDSTSCSKCEFFNAKNVLEYLNKFHYPLVTLTLFETEILKSYNEENAKFSENKVLMILKENGYYKEIEPEMTIKEILENTLIKTPW